MAFFNKKTASGQLVIGVASLCIALAAPLTAGSDGHWAWVSPSRPIPRPGLGSSWERGPIDRLLLTALDAGKLAPAEAAGRELLIRRVTFDLTGLPPEPREIDAFVADYAVDAWERVVDRLLASPRLGERWGRHWLDLARYAESNGFEHDESRPDAWRYRDYVIRSFNADKPYNRFVEEQIAGDELFADDPEALIATGFNLLGPDMTDASDQAQRRYNRLSDMTDTAGSVFLGMTLACARCHDHKFEPISQVDYFGFQAFFAPAELRADVVVAPGPEKTRHQQALAAYRELVQPTEVALAEIERPQRTHLREQKLLSIADQAQVAHRTPEEERTADQRELVAKTERFLVVGVDELVRALGQDQRAAREQLLSELKLLEARKPPRLATAMGLSSPAGEAPPAHVLEQGDLHRPGAPIGPRVPVVLTGTIAPLEAIGRQAHGRRAALARWLTQPCHPLTTRVMVNRLWQHLFGDGLVATTSDFGRRGEASKHPEILDWLAMELVDRGWSLKATIRAVVLSAAYRMSTLPASGARQVDGENRQLSRQNHRRLEAEAIRDAWLAAAGILDTGMGGPGRGPDPSKSTSTERGVNCRSVYLRVGRNSRLGLFEGLDLPDTNASCPERHQSMTAAQALTILNAPEVSLAAAAMARLLEREAATSGEQIDLAFRRILGRRPGVEEAAQAATFLADSPLRELVRALFNTSEALYID